MDVEVISARSAAELKRAAARAAEVLGTGGLIVHPTETVYGIGGDGSAANNELIARVKGREEAQPLILLAPNLERVRELVVALEWPAAAARLAERFWPGPLTIVVACGEAPPSLAGPGGGVAVRVTPHPTLRAIFERWPGVLTSTSANVSGGSPPRTLAEALQIFEGRDDLAELDCPVLAIDAGSTEATVASTIVTFVESPPRLLREGPIEFSEVRRVLPDVKT